MGDEAGEALPALLAASKAEDEGGKAARAALQAIRKAPRSSAPALLPLLKDPEPRVRLKAAEALCELEEGDKECLAALLELVKRRDPECRRGAATLLRRYGSAAREAVPALVEVVRNDPDPNTRQIAISALLAVGPEARKDTVPVLIEVVRNGPQSVVDLRMVAASALGTFGPEAKAAVPALKALAEEYRQQEAAAQDELKKPVGVSSPRAAEQVAQARQLAVQRFQGLEAAVQAALRKIEQ
jgi:HEAT repeat protein